MAIDGIGKPGRVGGTGGVPAPEAPGAAKEVFSASPAAGAAALGTPELGRLDRGEITLDQYLDARVDAATAHLEGRLGVEQLEFVKRSLREQLTSDPVLVELVQRATGRAGASEV